MDLSVLRQPLSRAIQILSHRCRVEKAAPTGAVSAGGELEQIQFVLGHVSIQRQTNERMFYADRAELACRDRCWRHSAVPHATLPSLRSRIPRSCLPCSPAGRFCLPRLTLLSASRLAGFSPNWELEPSVCDRLCPSDLLSRSDLHVLADCPVPTALIRAAAIRMRATMPEAPGRAHALSRHCKEPARASGPVLR
jgi:hypothetical protein